MNDQVDEPNRKSPWNATLLLATFVGFVGLVGIAHSVSRMFAPMQESRHPLSKAEPEQEHTQPRLSNPSGQQAWNPTQPPRRPKVDKNSPEYKNRFRNIELSEDPVQIQARQIEAIREHRRFSTDDHEATPDEKSIADLQTKGAIIW